MLVMSRFLSDLSPKDAYFPLVVSNAFNCSVLTELLPVGSGRDDALPCGSEVFLCQLTFLIDSVHSALIWQVINCITSVTGEGKLARGFWLYLSTKHLCRNVLIWCIPIAGMRCSSISVEIKMRR